MSDEYGGPVLAAIFVLMVVGVVVCLVMAIVSGELF
jgi:hypothetical protein